MKTTEQIEHDKNLRRVVVSSLVGAVIEWYDFFLYGVVAGLIFNHLYFPEFDDRIGTMLAFATFAHHEPPGNSFSQCRREKPAPGMRRLSVR